MTEGGVGINVIQLNEILPLNYIFSAPNMRRSQHFFVEKISSFQSNLPILSMQLLKTLEALDFARTKRKPLKVKQVDDIGIKRDSIKTVDIVIY